MAISAITERTNIADSAVVRAAGRTNSAAIASSSAIQAITALSPYGLKACQAPASTSCRAARTAATSAAKANSTDRPASGGSDVLRHTAARIASFTTPHTLIGLLSSEQVGIWRPREADRAYISRMLSAT